MNALVRLLSGNQGLARTYWGYGMAGGVAWVLTLLMAPPGSTLAVAGSLACAAYLLLINIAVWLAANRYEGPTTWAALAKVAAGLGFAMVAVWVVSFIVLLNGGSLQVPSPR